MPGPNWRETPGDLDPPHAGWRLRLGCARCSDLRVRASYISAIATGRNNRSKFNVALGIEAQGFCLIQ